MVIAITRGRPIPPEKHGKRKIGEKKYPWETMEIGDSFDFPDGMREETARSTASRRAKKDGRKYRVERLWPNTDPPGDGGCVCWRVA